MKQSIIYVGLDVDDTRYHVSGLNKDTGEVKRPLPVRCAQDAP